MLDAIDFDYAVVRLVPHVHLGAFVNVGVVLHARQARTFLVRLVDPSGVATVAGLPPKTVERFFDGYQRVAEANNAGALGLLPASERFHWLTAPRSAVLQTSPVHTGRADDLDAAFDALFKRLVPGRPI